MSTRLAIVGASVRAAAQSALRAGFEVVGADLFADADLDGVCPVTKIEGYPHGLADWLAEQDVDAWMYTGALENYPDLVDLMATLKPLWGVSGAALRRCRDPLVLQEVFAQSGVAFPETLSPGTPPTDGGVWLAKTYRHAAGVGVWRYGEHPDNASVYTQRFAEGGSLAAVFALSADAAVLLGVTRQLVESFGYRGSVGPVPLAATPLAALRRSGDALRVSLGLRGLVGVDLITADEGLSAIEVNPRYTASVEALERATGVSAIAAHAACFAHGPAPSAPPPFERCFGKRIVYAAEPLKVGEALAAALLELLRAGRVADAPRAGTAIGAGEPICTIRVEGASCSEVAEGLDAFSKDLLDRYVTRD